LGPNKSPINVIVEMEAKPYGYLVTRSAIVTDVAYAVYTRALERWQKALTEYYDIYKSSVSSTPTKSSDLIMPAAKLADPQSISPRSVAPMPKDTALVPTSAIPDYAKPIRAVLKLKNGLSGEAYMLGENQEYYKYSVDGSKERVSKVRKSLVESVTKLE
jgi:hypothetical protein